MLLADGFLLFRSNASVGIDGYYYVIQADVFRTTGHFYFPTSTPIVLIFFSVLSVLIPSTVIAIKAGVLMIQTFFYVGLAILIRKLTDEDLLSLLGLFLAFFSGLHFYYISEFLSNLGALTFLVWSALSFFRYAADGSRSYLIISMGLLVGACLCHRSIPYLLVSFFIAGILSVSYLRIRSRKQLILVVFAFFSVFFTPLIISIQPLFDLPPWINNEISPIPQNPFRPLMRMEGLCLALVDLVMIWTLFKHPQNTKINLTITTSLLLVVWNVMFLLNPFLQHPVGVNSLFARISTIAFIPFAILVPLVFRALSGLSQNLLYATCIMLIPILLFRLQTPFPVELRETSIRKREKLIRDVPTLVSQTCQYPFIVAKHGDQFLVTAVTGSPAQHLLPSENRYGCIFVLSQKPFNRTIGSLSARKIENSDGDISLVEISDPLQKK